MPVFELAKSQLIWQEIIRRYYIQYYDQIVQVTKPLYCFDITYVDYIKTYSNGLFVVLTNRPDYGEYFASEQLYLQDDPYFKKPDTYRAGFYWLKHLESNKLKDCLEQIEPKFDIHTQLMLIEKGLDYVEMFCFAGRTGEAIPTLHLQKPQLLKTFAVYYKNELSSILHRMEEESYSLIELVGENFYRDVCNPGIDSKSIHDFLAALGKKAEVDRAFSLSPRERECLKLLLRGNSAKDSAIELQLSPRTVEFYLENIKNKLNCSAKHELLSIGREFENLGIL